MQKFLHYYFKGCIFEKENAIKNLNEYLKYIPLYEELQKVKKEIKTNKEFTRILGDKFKDENTSLELLENIEYYTSNIIKSFDKETFSKILNDETLLETISKSSKEIEKILNNFENKFITFQKI